MLTEQDPGFEALLEHLTRYRGIDFTGYKSSSLFRRVMGRMNVVGVGGCMEYLAYLDEHPGEYTALFDSILINVTGFFRDEAAWGFVGETLLPDLLALKPAEEPVRVWSAGCASGEEVYTVAMLFAELLGPEAFHHRVKIYATDVDEEAIAQARQAVYNDQDMEFVPAALRPRYFETTGSRHVFRPDLRRSIVFGRHDVMRDAPISRVDLLVCRNTLMYFDREAQGRILTRFHLALVEDGYLFLGKAELSPAHSHVFQPVSLKHHIFRRVAVPDRTKGAKPGHANTGSDRRMQQSRQLGVVPMTRGRAKTGALLGVGHHSIGEPARIAGRFPGLPADLEALTAALLVTNEELETSNAEFESTNEELGSMNEELHSTNEELETLNTDLHRRTAELGTTNAILQSVLAGVRAGVAVVDRHLTVLLWNRGAEELWGLSADEVRGRSLSSAGLGLPAEQLQIVDFLAGSAPQKAMTVDTTCGDRPLRCRVTCTPFLGPGGGRAGAVLVMEEEAR